MAEGAIGPFDAFLAGVCQWVVIETRGDYCTGMAKGRNTSSGRTPEQAYEEALRQIEAARKENAETLDLRGLGLTAVPKELGELRPSRTCTSSKTNSRRFRRNWWS